MKKTITDRMMQSAKVGPGQKLVELNDDKVQGLSARITTKGNKSWTLRYRDDHGQRQRLTLGRYPELSTRDARIKAQGLLHEIAMGQDPKKKKQAATVQSLYEAYYHVHIAGLSKARQTDALWRQHILPALGGRKTEKLVRADISQLLQSKLKTGLTTQVNRIQEQINAFLNWCVNAGHLQSNPISGMRKLVKEQTRSRVFSDSELRAIWAATERLSVPSRFYVRLMILTGQRRDEVRCMVWQEIVNENWLLPAARNKSKRAHLVPLSSQALGVLDDIQRDGDFIFTIVGDKPYSGHSKLAQRLERISGVEDIELHDFRRTVRTGLSRLKVPKEVAERVINHATDTLDQTYNLYEFLDEKQQALQRWGDLVESIVNSGGDNVVRIARTF